MRDRTVPIPLVVVSPMVALLLVLSLASRPLALRASAGEGQQATQNYVVLTAPGHTDIDDAVAAAGGIVTGRHDAIGVVFASSDDAAFKATLAADARVTQIAEDIELQWLPNLRVAPTTVEEPTVADTIISGESRGALQWPLEHIRADVTAANGDLGWGVRRARVAVLDTGIYPTHIDIAANLNLGLSKSFVPSEPSIEPVVPGSFSHGTHVAGIVAAPINGIGTQGVAPRAEIVAVKVLRSTTGSGAFSWVVNAIMYAASDAVDADVINMSLGALFTRQELEIKLGPLVASLNRAIAYATAQGTLVVSAAGNDDVNLNSNVWFIPAQSANGMAVGALGPMGWALGSTNFDRKASYSNFGKSVLDVSGPGGDFALPGDDPCTVATLGGPITRPCWVFDMVFAPGAVIGASNVYFWAAGTSMATPHVSGVAALIVGKYGKMSPAQLQSRLEQTGVDILKPGADLMGKSRIDAVNAVQ